MPAPIDHLLDTKLFAKGLFLVAARSFNRCGRTLNPQTLARLWVSTLVGALVLATALDIGPASWASGALLRVLYLLAVKACNHLSRTVTGAWP